MQQSKHSTDSNSAFSRNAEAASHSIHNAIDSAAEMSTPAIKALVKATRQQIRSHPLIAVGVAVTSGVLFSWWLGHRSGANDVS